MKPMQILVVIALGSFLVWIASRVMHFYAPDAKGTGIYYAFALFFGLGRSASSSARASSFRSAGSLE